MEIYASLASRFLKSLGSPGGTISQMQVKLNTFLSWCDMAKEPPDGELTLLAREIWDTLQDNETITVIPDPEDKEEELSKSKRLDNSNLKKSGFWRQGVIGFIIEQLREANSSNPVTRRQLLARMLKRFPDREEKGMWTTLICQVPKRLVDQKGLNVLGSNDTGFWIE